MHLALPRKKVSIVTPYSPRSPRYPFLRRNKIQTIILFSCFMGVLIFFLSQVVSSSKSTSYGGSSVVIVTVLDHEKHGQRYIDNIKENRINYARKHGYITFFPNSTDYDLDGAPSSWACIPAVRHALAKFDSCMYAWYLGHESLIMNPSFTIEGDIMSPPKLETLMLRNQPIVLPNSVIKTFSNLKGANIDFVLTQDSNGLASSSFILRKGEWGKFFLDTWFDPLYRSYNFQKGHTHALEHIVQWHPTILSKLALVPQKTLNSDSHLDPTSETGFYHSGDFVVSLSGCEDTGRDCASEAQAYLKQSETEYRP